MPPALSSPVRERIVAGARAVARRLGALLTGAVVAAVTVVSAGAAPGADPGPPLPFLDARDSAARAPTYADLERALGVPPAAQVRPDGFTTVYPGLTLLGRQQGRNVRTGGELDMSYPALGLVFTIDRDDRPLKDPPIRLMTVTAPAVARTPQGLYIGQPQAEASAIARRHYEVLGERADGAAGTLQLAGTAGTPRHRLWLEMRGGALHRMQFDFKPPPPPLQRWLAPALLVLAVVMAAWAIAHWRDRLAIAWPVASDRTTVRVGRLLIGAGIGVGVAALASACFGTYVVFASAGNPYGALAGLAFGYYALCGLLLALVLVAVGRKIVRLA